MYTPREPYPVVNLCQPAPTRDVMEGDFRRNIKVGVHGLVGLVDVMPRTVPDGQTADSAIVQAARVSYGMGTKTASDDNTLIRYLFRHRHTTPLEMIELKFHHVMPVFVSRQWIRHRTANVNEYSARYSIVKDRFWKPESDEEIRVQSTTNKQGGDERASITSAGAFLEYLEKAESMYAEYTYLTDDDGPHHISRELARVGLPLTMYTEWYWKIDAHNLFRFLSLRLDSHAQKEIRDFAEAMFQLIRPIMPMACQAFIDYDTNMNGMAMSAGDIEAINTNGRALPKNKRELVELLAKVDRLGLTTLRGIVQNAVDLAK